MKRHSISISSFRLWSISKNVAYVIQMANASCKLLRYFVTDEKLFKMFSEASLIFSLKKNIRLLHI